MKAERVVNVEPHFLAAEKSREVGPDFIACTCEARPVPSRYRVVFWVGMADKNNLPVSKRRDHRASNGLAGRSFARFAFCHARDCGRVVPGQQGVSEAIFPASPFAPRCSGSSGMLESIRPPGGGCHWVVGAVGIEPTTSRV